MRSRARFASALLLGAATAAFAPPAAAQSLRPNILILFDTSGSMQLDATSTWAGERINEQAASCPAAPAGKVSRLFALKAALRDALAQTGTDEANFGLMSFPQLVNPMQPFGCFQCTSEACGVGAVGHYFLDATVGLGCRVSTDLAPQLNSTAAEPAFGAWFTQAINQALKVDLTKATPGVRPVTADFDPPDANIARIYRWIDNTEDPGTGATLTDPELHANGATPLGRSLFYARMYFDNFIRTAADPRRACRQNIIILVTDGNDTCDYNAGTALNYQTCAQTGFATFHPEVQACKLLRGSGVKTYVITDTSVSGNLNSNIAIAGGTGGAIKVSLTDTAAVKSALVGIIAETVPPAEICNGVDDNCNGKIDEGVSNMCAFDAVNLTHCAVETCNCKDDNCDGQVDEGLPTNACGGACGCAVPAEICDGLDNNCDGRVDEGFLVGAPCTNGQLGTCRRGGVLVCTADGRGTVCDAPTITPGKEYCNNLDDDCNGLKDDGILPGVGEACGNNLGVCMKGITQCVNGQLVCSSTTTPGVEVCNGLDDNCDGVIDNGDFPGVGDVCLCDGLTQAQVDAGGICKAGHKVCRGARGVVCEGCVLPTAEMCNGLDNNCDGMKDIQGTCPGSYGCRDGQCTLRCTASEFPCPAGYMCVGDFCIPQRCVGVTCPATQKCDNDTGLCIGLCEKVSCPSPQFCKEGRCVDCNSAGEACPAGQSCVGGVCKSDPCLGKSCPNGQYCSNGDCVEVCTSVNCAANQRCVAGACIDDPCASVACAQGQFCDITTGLCKPNACQAMQCAPGQRCIPGTGKCAADPCTFVQCPGSCYTCDITSDGRASCVVNDADPACKVVHVTTGQKGGGCACATGADGTGGGLGGATGLGLGLLGAALARRGRRRRG